MTIPPGLGPRLRAIGFAAILPAIGTSAAAPPPSCGLTGQLNGTTITYAFAGTLDAPFGSLPAGTPFTGSFSYTAGQPDLSPTNPNRGDYKYQSVSVTIGSTTVTDNGTGVINVYDAPGGYPTDLFHLYTYSVSGSFGGVSLAAGAGIQVVLQDGSGTAWTGTALPDEKLTLSDLTPSVNATFLELRSPPGPPGSDWTVRGALLSCCSTPPAAAAQSLLATIAGMGLPQGVKTSLSAPLSGSPNCGQAGAFTNQVNAKLQNGQLTPAQANTLLAAINSIKLCLGCP